MIEGLRSSRKARADSIWSESWENGFPFVSTLRKRSGCRWDISVLSVTTGGLSPPIYNGAILPLPKPSRYCTTPGATGAFEGSSYSPRAVSTSCAGVRLPSSTMAKNAGKAVVGSKHRITLTVREVGDVNQLFQVGHSRLAAGFGQQLRRMHRAQFGDAASAGTRGAVQSGQQGVEIGQKPARPTLCARTLPGDRGWALRRPVRSCTRH